jgi:UDP-N-acetylglucosamine enolpyruvyl transferase
MLAACAAQGETTTLGAAREPEIADLQRYLRCLGADLSGAGTAEITVRTANGKTAKITVRVVDAKPEDVYRIR